MVQFFEGAELAAIFQVPNDAAAQDSFDEAQYVRRLSRSIWQHVNMMRNLCY